MNSISIKLLLTTVAISSLLTSCRQEQSKPDESQSKPNFLFISVDDLNDWSKFLKNFPGVKTPNIDKLASQGAAFTNAHCQAPICAPSRASVFTGLYPHTTGLYYQFTDEDLLKNPIIMKKGTFLPDYLEKYGYKTFGVGKVFHNGDRNSVFDEYGGIYPKMQFGPKPKERVNYHWNWFSDKRRTATDWSPLDMADSEMSDYKIADWVINQLDKKHDQPFFLAAGFIRPHVPWHVPKKWFDLFDENEIEVPPYLENDFDDIPEISKALHDMPAMPNTNWLIKSGKWKSMVHAYLASMAFVDAQIGKVLSKLNKSDYKNNTIVILWSDHGYHLGEKGRTAKHSLWERSTHVPLIFYGTGIKPKKNHAAVGLIDIYPTILELANLPSKKSNEGHSLVPFLANNKKQWSHAALTSYGYKNVSLFMDEYHFIQYRNGEGELYHLKNDPNEWYNLFSNNEYGNIIERFKMKLPVTYAPLSLANRLNVNSYIDNELFEFGIKNPMKKN